MEENIRYGKPDASEDDLWNAIRTVHAEEIIKYLETNGGVANESVYQLYREIDDIIFSLYEIKNDEREIIISNIINRIDFCNKIYERF